MFESAELGHEIDKERYDAEVPELRRALLNAQYELVKSKKFAAVILIGGVDGGGKGDVVNLLNEWMDPRHLATNAMRPLGDDQSGRPPMYRFWRALPAAGRMALFVGTWYSDPLRRRVYGEAKKAELGESIEEINKLERMLADEGVLLLKFWLHLSRHGQKKRLKELESKKKTAWRVTETDWKHLAMYKKFNEVTQHLLRETSTAEAPWLVVESADSRYRDLTIGRAILAALRGRLDQKEKKAPHARAPASVQPIDGVTVIDRLDLDQRIESKDAYQDQLADLQGRLNAASRKKGFDKRSVVAVFEGVDAAGKGGAIRRVTQALDARKYDVIPIAAPTDEEKARPYLWRFWRNLPERGRIAIFDRSWYGRVLVERVEEFCAEPDWMRAYGEINDFEDRLIENRTVLLKFWLQISKDEQLKRFQEREQVPHKQHKITDEDWRNRDKWDAYNLAVNDMIDRTSTERAPWTLIGGNDKYHARIAVLRTLVEAIEAAI